jgi:hypothetical protein
MSPAVPQEHLNLHPKKQEQARLSLDYYDDDAGTPLDAHKLCDPNMMQIKRIVPSPVELSRTATILNAKPIKSIMYRSQNASLMNMNPKQYRTFSGAPY